MQSKMSDQITIILVKPQLGENIGMAARSMYNFGFTDLRIVNPRDGWPNESAAKASAAAISVIETAQIFPSLAEAIEDCDYIYASSARRRDLNLAVTSLKNSEEIYTDISNKKKIGILFGPENSGLSNDHLSFCNKILTIPVNKDCPSINLATSVGVICYEFSKNLRAFDTSNQEKLASRKDLTFLFNHLENKLEECNYFQIAEKKPVMMQNLKNIYNRIPNLSKNEYNALMGVFNALNQHNNK